MMDRKMVLGIGFLIFLLGSVPMARAEKSDLQSLVACLQVDQDNEIALREKIIKLVRSMRVKPEVPAGVEEAMGKAKFILANGNSTEDFAKAAEAYREASLLAPWEADIYYNLGYMREKAGEYSRALINYSLYLMARPDAKDKQSILEKIGAMEYAGHITFKELESPGKGTMVLIKAGKFKMGSPNNLGDGEEHPQHEVYLSAYYIDKYPVTNAAYDKFCEETHRNKPQPLETESEGQTFDKVARAQEPVVYVSWNDASAYAKWAGKRLPTEAEWEKAVRGGTDTKWFFGDDDSVKKEYGWYEPMKNFGDGAFPSFKVVSHPVGMKKPNPYGLYDTTGLVLEWCSDWYDSKYYKNSPDRNPQGPDKGGEKVLRGGCDGASDARSANRFWRKGPDTTDPGIGFRCVKDAEAAK